MRIMLLGVLFFIFALSPTDVSASEKISYLWLKPGDKYSGENPRCFAVRASDGEVLNDGQPVERKNCKKGVVTLYTCRSEEGCINDYELRYMVNEAIQSGDELLANAKKLQALIDAALADDAKLKLVKDRAPLVTWGNKTMPADPSKQHNSTAAF